MELKVKEQAILKLGSLLAKLGCVGVARVCVAGATLRL